MEKRNKFGIILIAAAAAIGGVFLWKSMAEDAVSEPINPPPAYEKEKPPVSGAAVETAAPAAEGTPVPEQNGDSMTIDINRDIIRFMGVTEKELAEELVAYANSCGQGAAEKVCGTEEMIVDYAGGTVTVPCCFVTAGKKAGFDMIYQYKRKKYRFVPW